MGAEQGLRNGLLPSVAAMTEHERRNFSISRLLRAISKEKHDSSLETDLSEAIAVDLGAPPHLGSWLPMRIQASASGLSTNTNSSGGFLKQTVVENNIVDALRAHTRVLSLGAQFLTGLKFTRVFPVEGNVMAGSWGADDPGTDVTSSDPSFAARSLSPHVLQCTTSISRQLLEQSSPDLDAWIGTRLAKAHALSLDSAAINGTGANAQPVGLLATAGIGSVAIGTDGGAPLSDVINALEAAVSLANGDDGSMGYLTNSTMRSKLRKLPSINSTYASTPLWTDGKLLDTRAVVSNQIPANLRKGANSDCSAIICGAWDQFLVGEFNGAIELISDPFSLARSGMIEITSFAMYDCLALQPAAFAACLDARNV
jgi:HK97 family phage major capsid protein